MSSVHLAISKQVNKTVSTIEQYRKMDAKREGIIEELMSDYRSGKKIDLTELNQWTENMNQFAVENQLPPRKIVTIEMFETFVTKDLT